MAATYSAVIQQHGEWWIGWVEEVPGVNSQGTTREELLENLRVHVVVNLPAIDNRSGASLFRHEDTEEVDLARPGAHV